MVISFDTVTLKDRIMHGNEDYFPGGHPTTDVKLAALNLQDTSSGGGLKFSARVVSIPQG